MTRLKSACECGNCEFGFNCMVEHSQKNPGSNSYTCMWCGIYGAANPACSEYEQFEETTEELA